MSRAPCLSPGSFPSPGCFEREDAPEKQEILGKAVHLTCPSKVKGGRLKYPEPLHSCWGRAHVANRAEKPLAHSTSPWGMVPAGGCPNRCNADSGNNSWSQESRQIVSHVLTGEVGRELAIRQIPEK